MRTMDTMDTMGNGVPRAKLRRACDWPGRRQRDQAAMRVMTRGNSAAAGGV